jgi:copper ion binding protein
MEKTITIPVEGMSCEHCVRAVKGALETQKGVKAVEVSLEGKSARVIYDEGLIDLDALKAAILEEGYQVR